MDCVFHASGIIPRTRIAFSMPPELSRALGLRFPSLRNYPAHLVCAILASGIIPGPVIVMHVGKRDGYVLRVAGLTIERHQERVRII
jgi:hypothetical protein